MKHYNILIIGGSAGGLSALRSCARLYPEKSKAIIKLDSKTLIPCAIPYVYGELHNSNNNLIPNGIIEKCGAEMIIGEVEKIDKKNKIVIFKDNKEISYEKLIISTGSSPIIPKIPGYEKNGIFYIKKDAKIIDEISEKISKAQNIVIIGGGYIGVEFAEQIKEISNHKNITIIEGSESCLSMTFDKRYTEEIENKLRYVGINIVKNKLVSEFCGDKQNINSVKLNDGTIIDCDLAIVAIGIKPNVEFAKSSKIKLGKSKSIKVDRFMKVDKNIYACGDCVENFSFFTHEISNVKLASTASMEGRLVAENLYKNNFPNPGIIGVYVTKVHDKAYAGAGYTKKAAEKEGLEIVEGYAKVINRHPGSLNGAGEIEITLIFNKKSKRIIGAQISGPLVIGETINILGLAIEKKMTAYELFFMQPATQPKISASPIMYPIVEATEDALKQFN